MSDPFQFGRRAPPRTRRSTRTRRVARGAFAPRPLLSSRAIVTSALPSLVHELLARVEASRWLCPDASMEALDGEALAWLEERADEHLNALMPENPDAPPGALRVVTARDVDEVAALLDAAWAPVFDRASTPLWQLHALEAAMASLDMRAGDVAHAASLDAARTALSTSVQRAWQNAPPWTRDEISTFTNSHGSATAPEVVAWHDLRWRVIHGAARPSPWAPLCAIWERGAWPMLLPDDALLVYVPQRRAEMTGLGALLPTEPAVPGHAWQRRPRPAPWTTRIGSLRSAGLPPMVRIDVVDAVLDAERLVTPGMVPPVGTLPPLPAPLPPPPAEPWYKRLLRRVTG